MWCICVTWQVIQWLCLEPNLTNQRSQIFWHQSIAHLLSPACSSGEKIIVVSVHYGTDLLLSSVSALTISYRTFSTMFCLFVGIGCLQAQGIHSQYMFFWMGSWVQLSGLFLKHLLIVGRWQKSLCHLPLYSEWVFSSKLYDFGFWAKHTPHTHTQDIFWSHTIALSEKVFKMLRDSSPRNENSVISHYSLTSFQTCMWYIKEDILKNVVDQTVLVPLTSIELNKIQWRSIGTKTVPQKNASHMVWNDLNLS